MTRIFFLSKLLIGIFVAAILVAGSAYAQKKEQFVIEIIDPRSDSKVGRETTVKGTALLPSGHYLWVLARRSDFKPLWWPQREAEVDPKTHKWSATAVFGGPQDIGWDFDIGVITVNAEGHALLRDYWIKAMRTGDWRPIEIPPTSSAPQTLKVKKVSH